jgi:putative sugar O-methyltransferase
MASILAIARQHLSDALSDPAHGLPDPGPRWGTLAAWCRRNIARFQSEDDAIHFAQAPLGHGGFEARLTGEALAAHADKLEAMLQRDFPQAAAHFTSFVEPEVSRPETTTIRDGRRVSGPMLVHMLFYFSCATRIPDMDRVCEIGGGYGAPARLFMTNSFCRPRSYMIVDLPESLFFAEVYLRTTLGHDRVRYVASGETIDPATPEDGVVILCPVARRSALQRIRFDLVLNTLSMQEMTDEYVAFYGDWLDRQGAAHFYSFNYFLQRIEDRTESANVFTPRLSARWDVTWSQVIGERPYLSLHVLARRTPASTIAARNDLAIGEHFRRPLGLASIYPLLHVAETSPDARFAYRLVMALMEDLDFRPKEAVFLVDHIGRLESRAALLTAAELAGVGAVRDTLGCLLSVAPGARVPPHLEELQRDLYSN